MGFMYSARLCMSDVFKPQKKIDLGTCKNNTSADSFQMTKQVTATPGTLTQKCWQDTVATCNGRSTQTDCKGGREVVQSAKCLLCKHEYPCLAPSAHIKARQYTCNPKNVEVDTGRLLQFIDQPDEPVGELWFQ